jgi:hypothetical protein
MMGDRGGYRAESFTGIPLTVVIVGPAAQPEAGFLERNDSSDLDT